VFGVEGINEGIKNHFWRRNTPKNGDKVGGIPQN